jgi:hypothetical protein
LYFPCKIYEEKLWSCVTKVVALFTWNPTKLSLQFSDFSTIFYRFYKIEPKGFTIEDSVLQ